MLVRFHYVPGTELGPLHVLTLQISHQPLDNGAITVSILQMARLKYRDVKQMVQGHTENKQLSQDLNSESLAL